MNLLSLVFDEERVLHKLEHYLPSQAPLKDFVHHNSLHAFQHENFHEALQSATQIFGYKTYLELESYRNLYLNNKINKDILKRIIREKKEENECSLWMDRLLNKEYDETIEMKIGYVRNHWKHTCRINLDKAVHPKLFRNLGAYLDQGVSIWEMPKNSRGFLATLREMERTSYKSLFRHKIAQNLLLHSHCTIRQLLDMVVGDERLYEYYLFDMQFAHPGWSGMVAVIENMPESLLDKRLISLHDLICVELLLEIDELEEREGGEFKPLAERCTIDAKDLFEKTICTELDEVYALWQEAYEWTYLDQVIKGLSQKREKSEKRNPSFQAVFCIDDRASSLRTYMEMEDKDCQTFGTAGFFNIPCYFQPEHGKFYTKICPAPVTPTHLVRESEAGIRHRRDSHFGKTSKGFFSGLIMSQTMGFWSALKMVGSIFHPTESPAMVSSFKHMDPGGRLSIENKDDAHVHDLQIGFTLDEMIEKVEWLLKSIGLVSDFAPLVYFIGHGASSVNNTYYAGYDCGACSGRAGSVNARVAADIANRQYVRLGLKARGINIPDSTRFIGGLHDTTRDEMEFYDLNVLPEQLRWLHEMKMELMAKVLLRNSRERARRFLLVDHTAPLHRVHEQVKLRALSLFEPRPEWNHATNAVCIVGSREHNKHLFLDRRAFLQSYDYKLDPEGDLLVAVLGAVTPVCGGINLEYYFSRVDNQRLGAGSKLPHNVMGLIGLTNGMEGDLRPGLPEQMVSIHDPVRLLIVVEHYPEIVLNAIKCESATYEWFKNEWVLLCVIHPETRQCFRYKSDGFVSYEALHGGLDEVKDLDALLANSRENIDVHVIAS